MIHQVNYQVRFTFSSLTKDRMFVCPSINLFLGALEDADRCMAENLGFIMESRQEMTDMGELFFCYSRQLSLRWPSQMLLGSWPKADSLAEWMKRVREDLLNSLAEGGTESETRILMERWDGWAREKGLTDVLAYVPVALNQITLLWDNLKRASDALGEGGQAVLEQAMES